MVNQKYLGSADKLVSIVQKADTPLQDRVLCSDVSEFEAITLLCDIATRLDIVQLIDELLPERKQGASVGSYILTDAINRAVEPGSTKQLKDW